MKRLAIALALLLSSTVAVAQPAVDATAERREKIKQRIRALRAYTLTEQLALDEATAAKLFPALAKYDEEFDKLLRARADLQRRLRDTGATKDAKVVDALIDEAAANQRAIWDAETRRLDQLRKILTPAQVARLLIVLPAMERKIQSQLRKAAEKNAASFNKRDAAAAMPKRDPAKRDLDAVEDPFYDERAQKRPPQAPTPAPAPRRKPAVCDPFTNPHGCK